MLPRTQSLRVGVTIAVKMRTSVLTAVGRSSLASGCRWVWGREGSELLKKFSNSECIENYQGPVSGGKPAAWLQKFFVLPASVLTSHPP